MAFDLFDEENSGEIQTSVLDQVMQALGQKPSKEEIEDMINNVDQDGNGTVDFQEFKELMARQISMSDAELEVELLEAFKVFDSKGSLVIPAFELKQVMLGFLTEEEIKDFIKAADVDKDGKIKGEKFVKMMMEK